MCSTLLATSPISDENDAAPAWPGASRVSTRKPSVSCSM
jgi:hypothetical protein